MSDEAPAPAAAAEEAQLPAVRPAREIARVSDYQPLFDTEKFEHFQRAAKALMRSTLLPPSVKGGTPEECFSNLILIFEQADRWRMPATALAQCVSIVHGKLMYEGKVINAMLEAVLQTRLFYHWTGERGEPDYRIYVWDQDFGSLSDEALAALAPGKYPRGARMIDGSVGDWRTFQKDNRTPNPAWTGAATRNQLAYRGAREWARLYEAGTMLGVYGEDEISAWEDQRLINVTPGRTSEQEVITAGFTKPAEGAIDAEFTTVETGDQVEGGDQESGPGTGETTPAEGQEGDSEAGQDGPSESGDDVTPEDDDQAGEAGDEELVEEGDGDDAAAAAGEAVKPTAGELDLRPQEPADDAQEGEEDDETAFQDQDAIDYFMTSIRDQVDWASIKAMLTALTKSPDWKSAGRDRQRSVRIAAWLRVEELRARGAGHVIDILEDLTAFRCWAETQERPDPVQDNWQVLVRQKLWKDLSDAQRTAFEEIIMAIIKRHGS